MYIFRSNIYIMLHKHFNILPVTHNIFYEVADTVVN